MLKFCHNFRKISVYNIVNGKGKRYRKWCLLAKKIADIRRLFKECGINEQICT